MRGSSAEWVYTTCDPVALHVAHHCLRQDYDAPLPPHKKLWYYVALCHSESIVDQEMSLAKTARLVYELRSSQWSAWHPCFKDMLSYAIKYYTIIDKFGRFPHRNEILKRDATEEEKKFLEAGGSHV